jgi:hypothetical protein
MQAPAPMTLGNMRQNGVRLLIVECISDDSALPQHCSIMAWEEWTVALRSWKVSRRRGLIILLDQGLPGSTIAFKCEAPR